jgi:hypothetical protein
MQNISFLAIFISPLILLHPKKFDQTAIRRDVLIAVSLLSVFINVHLEVNMAATLIAWKFET